MAIKNYPRELIIVLLIMVTCCLTGSFSKPQLSFAAQTTPTNLPTIAQLAQNSTGVGIISHGYTTTTGLMSHPVTLSGPIYVTPQSGTWGSVPWNLDADGNLTLDSGTGADTGGVSPWANIPSSIVSVNIVGNVTAPPDCSNLFSPIAFMSSFDVSGSIDFSNTTNMKNMFYYCYDLTDISGLANQNVTNVTDMDHMFYGCSALTNVDALANWNVANVTDMDNMFCGCPALQNVNGLADWKTQNVTDLSFMFSACTALTDISGVKSWYTNKVTNISDIFNDCPAINDFSPVQGWNVNQVTDMSQAFCQGFYQAGSTQATTLDLSGWDTSNCGHFDDMFSGNSGIITLNLGNQFAIKGGASDTDMIDNMAALRQVTFGSKVVNSVNFPISALNDVWENVGTGTTEAPQGSVRYDLYNSAYNGQHPDTYVLKQPQFGLQINVKGSDSAPLAGIGLQITPDSTTQQDTQQGTVTATTNANGQVVLNNLALGTYAVVQTSTASGYELPNPNSFPVTLTAYNEVSNPAIVNITDNSLISPTLSLSASTFLEFGEVDLGAIGYHNISQIDGGDLSASCSSSTAVYRVAARVAQDLTDSTGTSLAQGIGYRTDANTVVPLTNSPYPITAATTGNTDISNSWWNGSRIGANQVRGPVVNLTTSNQRAVHVGNYTGMIDWSMTLGPS